MKTSSRLKIALEQSNSLSEILRGSIYTRLEAGNRQLVRVGGDNFLSKLWAKSLPFSSAR